MEPDGSITLNILFLFALILSNAFFAMSEIAIISLNDNRVRKMAQEGHKKAALILKLVEQPSRFLATIQVGVTLSGFLASAVAASTFAEYIVYAMRGLPFSPTAVHAVSVFIITLILSYITLVFGELVPKRIAMQHSQQISFAVAGALSFMSVVGRPFVALLSTSTNALLRLIGIDPESRPDQVTEEEIRMMIDAGNESGNIEQTEMDMINNIFEFDDRMVEELMTHRTEVVAVELGTPLTEVIKLALDSGYSRIPVYEDDLDSVRGILYVKDLLELVTGVQKDFNLLSYLRLPLYVPESTSCESLLREFKNEKLHMAIVVDEYGGTSGIVTMEDLLEAIVGNIQDEYDDEAEEIVQLSQGEYLIDGLAAVEDVAKALSIVLPEDEFDTIGGYVCSLLGRIPSEHENPSVELSGVKLKVLEMDERRIAKLSAIVALE